MASRILCINCGINLNRLVRHIAVEQDTRVVSFIAERISPRIITENDYICQACLDNIIRRVNQVTHGEVTNNDSQLPSSSHSQAVGHSKVCLMCGCSILRRRSDQILRSNPSELQQTIATIIMNSIQSTELTTKDRVCHSCWMKSKRTAQRIESNQLERPSNSMEEYNNIDNSQQRSDDEDIVMANPSVSPASSQLEWSSGVPAVVKPAPVHITTITMQNYRRASNTANRCTFSLCTSQELHRISDDLRVKIIIDHNYYLPKLARVCTEHLLANSWDTLYTSENSRAEFTVEQIEHMFSYINFRQTKAEIKKYLFVRR